MIMKGKRIFFWNSFKVSIQRENIDLIFEIRVLSLFYYRQQRGKSRWIRRRDRYFRFEQGRAFNLERKITAQRSNSSHHRTFDRKYYDLCCAHFRGQCGHHHGGYFSRHQYQIQKSKVIKIAGIILSFFSPFSLISSRVRFARCDSSDITRRETNWIVSKRDVIYY